jgi:hypothetical protein
VDASTGQDETAARSVTSVDPRIVTAVGGPDVEVEWYAGDRAALRPLFELAEDSPSSVTCAP